MKYLKVWTSFLDVIQPKNGPLYADDAIGRLFIMMLKYAENGEEPVSFQGNECFAWPFAKQIIDRMAEENARLSRNGKNGGRPPKNKESDETSENQLKPIETKENQTKPTESQKEKEKKEKERNEKESENIIPLKRFIPPTVDEVALYCFERHNHVSAQKFVDYYSSNGWKVGKNPMKDWKAAVRTWERSEFTERDYQYEKETSGLPY